MPPPAAAAGHRRRPGLLLLAHAALALAAAACAAASTGSSNSSSSQDGGDTWAVILSSSRYWLNYRHSANALAVYQAVRRWAQRRALQLARIVPGAYVMARGHEPAWHGRLPAASPSAAAGAPAPHAPPLPPPHHPCRRLGMPDSRILLMLADQPGCSPRNVHPGQLYLAPAGGAAGAARASAACAGDDASGLGGNLLAGDVEVDYRGREASVDALLRVLTGGWPRWQGSRAGN